MRQVQSADHLCAVAFLIFALLAPAHAVTPSPCGMPAKSSALPTATVERISDGDTVVLLRFADGRRERARLIGIDTPETHQNQRDAARSGQDRATIQALGLQAAAFTMRLWSIRLWEWSRTSRRGIGTGGSSPTSGWRTVRYDHARGLRPAIDRAAERAVRGAVPPVRAMGARRGARVCGAIMKPSDVKRRWAWQ